MEGQYVVGDLREQTLDEIWNSERYKSVRYRINNAEKNPHEEPEICKNCLKWTLKESMENSRVKSSVNGDIRFNKKPEDFV